MKSLTIKVLMILFGAFAIFGAINFGIQRFIIYPSFLSLEYDEAKKDYDRTAQALKREIFHLNALCHDWSAWDDSYEFIDTPSEAFIKSNLMISTFVDNHINFISFCDLNGKAVWSQMYKLDPEQRLQSHLFNNLSVIKNKSLITYNVKKTPLSKLSVSGIIKTKNGFMIIASRPILTTNNTGPIRGSIIFGKLINKKIIKSLTRQTQVSLTLYDLHDNNLPDIFKGTKPLTRHLEKQNDKLHYYDQIRSIDGKPICVIKTTTPRHISAKGAETVLNAIILLSVTALMVFIIVIIIVRHFILYPIIELTRHTATIRRNNDYSMRLSIKDNDELGLLADEFDKMLEYIEKQNKELINDIEQRKIAEHSLAASEEIFRGLAERSFDLIFIVDYKMNVKYVSPAIHSIFGYYPEEVMEKSVHNFIADVEQTKVTQLINSFMKGKQVDVVQIEAIKKNGTPVIIECNASAALESGKIVGAQGIIRDITKRIKAEEKLRDIQTQALQAEKMAALGSMVAGLAHEISTPMGVGLMAATLLKDESRKINNIYNTRELKRSDLEKFLKKANESSSIIHRNLNQAAELVSSFKMVSVDQMKDELRVFNLNEYIHNVLLSLKPKYARTKHKIRVVCPVDLKLNSHPGAFSQIITNLVMNSLIHGFENIEQGEILFDISTRDHSLFFNYSDNGNGMTRKNADRIFEPFFTTRRNNGGTGLGMHIVYNLITHKIGGKIQCTSEPGHGITFHITLPFDPENRNIKTKL